MTWTFHTLSLLSNFPQNTDKVSLKKQQEEKSKGGVKVWLIYQGLKAEKEKVEEPQRKTNNKGMYYLICTKVPF